MLLLPLISFIFGFCVMIGILIYREEKEVGFSVFMSFASGFVLFIFFGIFLVTLYEITSVEISTTKEIPIYSLERDINISGRFVLGTGTIKTESVYYSYIKINDNEYKLYNFNTDKSTLILQDTKAPYIKIEEFYKHSDFMNKWFYMNDEELSKVIYKFYVPSTTIVGAYKG